MGCSSSSSRRNKAVPAKHSEVGASVSVRIDKEDYLDSSNSNDDGEWNDLPPLPSGKRSYHYLLKLLFVGDCHTGKTQLISRFAEEYFNHTYIPTLGIDFKVKSITMDERRFKLQIWDTSGVDVRFRTVTTTYFRGAKGIFIVYDPQNKASFDILHEWLRDIKKYAPPDVHLSLLGNKYDVKEEAEQELEDYYKAKGFADKNGMAFFEVSAKDATNVELAVTNMVARIWRTMIKQNS